MLLPYVDWYKADQAKGKISRLYLQPDTVLVMLLPYVDWYKEDQAKGKIFIYGLNFIELSSQIVIKHSFPILAIYYQIFQGPPFSESGTSI